MYRKRGGNMGWETIGCGYTTYSAVYKPIRFKNIVSEYEIYKWVKKNYERLFKKYKNKYITVGFKKMFGIIVHRKIFGCYDNLVEAIRESDKQDKFYCKIYKCTENGPIGHSFNTTICVINDINTK